MFCNRCGQKNPRGAQYCQKCGDRIGQETAVADRAKFSYAQSAGHLLCPNCGSTINRSLLRICPTCGRQIGRSKRRLRSTIVCFALFLLLFIVLAGNPYETARRRAIAAVQVDANRVYPSLSNGSAEDLIEWYEDKGDYLDQRMRAWYRNNEIFFWVQFTFDIVCLVLFIVTLINFIAWISGRE